MEKFTEYSKGLPLSREIFDKMFPKPVSHEEWAESFNKIGDINEVINKFNFVRKRCGDENHSNL